MPWNETGQPIIHRVANQIIHPGQWYDGPELGPDGAYLPQPELEEGAPAPATDAAEQLHTAAVTASMIKEVGEHFPDLVALWDIDHVAVVLLEGVDPAEVLGAPPGDDGSSGGGGQKALKDLTNAELEKLAESMSLELKGRPNKAELIALIEGAGKVQK